MISKSDFQNWKQDPVTQAFFEACEERMEDSKEILSISAGLDGVADNFHRGFIAAYSEIPLIRVDEDEE
jgi:hypothetical protein